jgi:hypothetical protein
LPPPDYLDPRRLISLSPSVVILVAAALVVIVAQEAVAFGKRKALGGSAGSGSGAVQFGGRPVPGQQLGDRPSGVVGDADEDVGEVALWVKAAEFDGLDQ